MEETLALHLFIGFGAMAVAWLFFAVPLLRMNLFTSILVLLLWCVVAPFVMTSSGAMERSIEPEFLTIKLWSICIGLILVQYFIYRAYQSRNTKLLTYVAVGILAINMLEAIVFQMREYQKNKDPVDLVNSIFGSLMVFSVLVWYSRPSNTMFPVSSVEMESNLSWWFIIGYSSWNLLFRSRLYANPSTFLFLMPSIVLPILTHWYGFADWYQMRLMGLITVIVLQFGLAEGEGTFFTGYNNSGVDSEKNKESILTKIQKEEAFEYGLLAVSGISTLLLFI